MLFIIGDVENQPLQALNLGSISGITVATTLIVEIIKRFLCYPFFKKVPVWIYAAVVSTILALVANKVIKLDDGNPLLVGNTWKVVWAALISALGSSGFYTWLKNPEQLETASSLSKGDVVSGAKKMIGVIVLMGMVGGCQACPQKAVLRESMDQGTRTIRAQHKSWAHDLVVDPTTGRDHRERLPTITADQIRLIDQAHKEYEDLVAADRAHDTP